MGKSQPQAPAAPDPNTIINAATAANKDAATYQSGLNNVNYTGPQGVVSYNQASPGRWTENVQLNPTEQATYDMANNVQYRAAKIADNQLLNIGNVLGQGLQTPTFQNGPGVGNLQYSYDQGGQIQRGYNPGGQIQTDVAPTYSPFVGVGQYSPQGAQADPHAGMHYDQSSGWIPAQAFGEDPTGHPGQMYDPSQGWVTADSRAVAPPQPQGTQMGFNDPYASIFSNPVATTQLATYANARQMLDPQWNQASEQQAAQLAAQGLTPGSAAYNNAMQVFGNNRAQAYNDAIFGAIGAGNTEQNTLFGQNLNSMQAHNSAQQQQNQQNLQAMQAGNQAQLQQNQENAAAAAFNNSTWGQNWQEQFANTQLANQNAQQHFQDTAYASQLPINEFTALMGNTQVGMPPSSPAQNTSVAAPDVTGAYGLQAQVNQANYAAAMQNYQSSLGGLFNLGSAAIGAIPFI